MTDVLMTYIILVYMVMAYIFMAYLVVEDHVEICLEDLAKFRFRGWDPGCTWCSSAQT